MVLDSFRKLLFNIQLPETVWVVLKPHPNEGSTVHAICFSEKLAYKAVTILAAKLQNPESSFEVREIATNAVHLYGIEVMEDSLDIE